MAYDHKTQSFMKNGGQQKYLDKSMKGSITEKELKYFLYNYKNACNLGKLYLLPKIHKRLFNVPGRPVISNCGTPTEKASEFLDHHLKPVWFRYIGDIFSSALMAKNTLNYS